MRNILILLAIITLIGISSNYAYAEEMKLSTFQEIAQIIIDNDISFYIILYGKQVVNNSIF